MTVRTYDPSVYALAQSFVDDLDVPTMTAQERADWSHRVSVRIADVIADECECIVQERDAKDDEQRSLRRYTEEERSRI